jgi:hypothetical protein
MISDMFSMLIATQKYSAAEELLPVVRACASNDTGKNKDARYEDSGTSAK